MAQLTDLPDRIGLYRDAARARLLDERLLVLSKAGRIGYHPDAQRAELVQVAAAHALAAHDWVFPTPRDHAVALVRGASYVEYLHHVFGNAADGTAGHATPGSFASRKLRIAPPSTQVSQHLTHAAGLAWAAKLRRVPTAEQEVVLAFFSETAADAGDFHSAVNFAGVLKAPIVFVCKTDGSEAPAPDVEVRDKGVAYGVHAEECAALPGEVYASVTRALVRARQGEGPTLLEVRIGTTPDPLEVLRAELLASGVLDELDDFAWRREEMTQMDAAIASASSWPRPALDTIFDHVFAQPSTIHAADRARLSANAEGTR